MVELFSPNLWRGTPRYVIATPRKATENNLTLPSSACLSWKFRKLISTVHLRLSAERKILRRQLTIRMWVDIVEFDGLFKVSYMSFWCPRTDDDDTIGSNRNLIGRDNMTNYTKIFEMLVKSPKPSKRVNRYHSHRNQQVRSRFALFSLNLCPRRNIFRVEKCVCVCVCTRVLFWKTFES